MGTQRGESIIALFASTIYTLMAASTTAKIHTSSLLEQRHPCHGYMEPQ
jgi:hypothetical protein